MHHSRKLFALAVTVLISHFAIAQTTQDSSLTDYLEQIQQTYETGSLDELKKLFAYEGQLSLISWIEEYELPRQAGEVRAIASSEDSAIVLMFNRIISDHPIFSTMVQSGLSGFYKLNKDQNGWHISDRIAIGRANRIEQQTLDVVIDPGVKMQIVDTLLVDVADPLGFRMTLNSQARISRVLLQGEEVDYTFECGLFSIDVTNILNGELVVEYSLDTAALNRPEYVDFAKNYGMVRQNFWHPIFKFGSARDIADFLIRVQIPADYQLTTSFPVTSQVQNGVRLIQSESLYPTADLALLYDNEWQIKQRRYPPMTFEIFATSDYNPSEEAVFRIMQQTNDLLTAKFGPSTSNYFGLVQSRILKGSYWNAQTNCIFISAENGGPPINKSPTPRAKVAHEVSHAWTNPSGPARLFLMEGWATFIETYFLQEAYGDSVVHAYWQKQKERYHEGNYDGTISLWEDGTNSGVSYWKGSWVLKILHDMLGEKVFETGFKNYIQNTITEDKDIYAFAKSMSAAAGFDVWPMLETWLKSKHIPEVKAFVQDRKLVVEQTGDDVFQFPLEVALKTPDGVRPQTYMIKKRRSQFSIKNADEVTGIQIDPNNEMLLKVRE